MGKNITILPDNLLLQPNSVALFTIRHPVLLLPSLYKALARSNPQPSKRELQIGSNLGFSRTLYDWYSGNNVQTCIVDADDYMTNPSFVQEIAREVGLDSAGVVDSWAKSTDKEKEEMHPELLKIQETLVNSVAVDPSRASVHVDLDAQKASWDHEFGAEQAELLRELVALAMPNYEYLRERRLRPSAKI
jgi:hypothetical protein